MILKIIPLAIALLNLSLLIYIPITEITTLNLAIMAILLLSLIFNIYLFTQLLPLSQSYKAASDFLLRTQPSSAKSLKSLLKVIPKIETYLTTIEKISLDTSRILITQNLSLRGSNLELTQAQQIALEEQNKLTSLLEGIKDGVVVINHNYQIVIFNPAAASLTGATQGQALTKPLDEIVVLQETNQPYLAKDYAATNRQTFFKEGVQLIGPNHQLLYVNLSVHKITDHSQLGWIITLHNVTEEQQLMRMKLDFASMAAHELRTPLTTIQGYLSFLQTPATLDKLTPAEQEFITKANMSTVRLNRLIENVLSVSKIEQGQLALTLQPAQSEKIIEKLIVEYTGLAQTKNLKLIFTSPPVPTPMVMADANKIEEVISNLVGNAVKYSERGSVEISLHAQGDFVITSITDTGKGIPSESISKLFTKFFRVQGELKSGSKGTGLGLYICKNIIDAHGGKIWVESVLNQGSTFSFSLPIAKESLPGSDSSASPEQPPTETPASPTPPESEQTIPETTTTPENSSS